MKWSVVCRAVDPHSFFVDQDPAVFLCRSSFTNLQFDFIICKLYEDFALNDPLSSLTIGFIFPFLISLLFLNFNKNKFFEINFHAFKKKSFFFFWIRMPIPNTDPDPGGKLNAHPDPLPWNL